MRAWPLVALALGCSLTSAPPSSAQVVGTPDRPPPAVPRAAGLARLTAVVRVTAGASPTARLPMVIAVHGLGDRPEDFVTLFDAMPTPVRVIALRGLAPFGDGFSWFPPGEADRDAAAFLAAVDAIAEAIPELRRQHPTCGRPVITGFSQGGMLSFGVAVRAPGLVHAAVPIAGRLPAALVQHHYPGRIVPEVTALHGMDDRRIAFAQGEASVRALQRMGFASTLRPFAGVGHAIPPAMRAVLYDELRRSTSGLCER